MKLFCWFVLATGALSGPTIYADWVYRSTPAQSLTLYSESGVTLKPLPLVSNPHASDEKLFSEALGRFLAQEEVRPLQGLNKIGNASWLTENKTWSNAYDTFLKNFRFSKDPNLSLTLISKDPVGLTTLEYNQIHNAARAAHKALPQN